MYEAHAREVRKRLRNPVNAVVDLGIDLKRKVIPINVIPFDAPVPVVVTPKQEFKPYIVPRASPTLDDITEEARKFYLVKKMDFISDRRLAILVRARQVAMYLAREMTPYSLPKIAKHVGDKDHTTVLHGARSIASRIIYDERLHDEVDLVRIKVNERVAARNAVHAQVEMFSCLDIREW